MNWKDVKLNVYKELEEYSKNPFTDYIEDAVERISIVYDIPREEIELWPLKKLTKKAREVQFTLTNPIISVDKTFWHKRKRYIRSSYDEITLGQMADIEGYLRIYKDSHLKLVQYILAVLYTGSYFGKFKYDISDIDKRAEIFVDLDAQTALSHYVSFLEYRNELYKKRFAVLFDDSEGESDDDLSDFESKKNRLREEMAAQWNWYGIIYKIADGDQLKFGDVAKLRLTEVLVRLSYEKQMAE